MWCHFTVKVFSDDLSLSLMIMIPANTVDPWPLFRRSLRQPSMWPNPTTKQVHARRHNVEGPMTIGRQTRKRKQIAWQPSTSSGVFELSYVVLMLSP